MFTLTFCDISGNLPLFNIAVFDDMFAALRWVRENIHNSAGWDWAFDGDCLYTDLNKTFTDAGGRLYSGAYGISLN